VEKFDFFKPSFKVSFVTKQIYYSVNYFVCFIFVLNFFDLLIKISHTFPKYSRPHLACVDKVTETHVEMALTNLKFFLEVIKNLY